MRDPGKHWKLLAWDAYGGAAWERAGRGASRNGAVALYWSRGARRVLRLTSSPRRLPRRRHKRSLLGPPLCPSLQGQRGAPIHSPSATPLPPRRLSCQSTIRPRPKSPLTRALPRPSRRSVRRTMRRPPRSSPRGTSIAECVLKPRLEPPFRSSKIRAPSTLKSLRDGSVRLEHRLEACATVRVNRSLACRAAAVRRRCESPARPCSR